MANNLKIYSNDGRETSYDIYVDGVFKVNVPISPTPSEYEVDASSSVSTEIGIDGTTCSVNYKD